MIRNGLMVALGLGLVVAPCYGAGEVGELTEKNLLEAVRQGAAATSGAELSASTASLQDSMYQERFEAESFASAKRSDTRQRGTFPFAPATGPVDSYEVGVRKGLPYGMNTSLSVFTEQVSLTDDSIERSTTSGLRATLNFDLWKNFLGSLDRLELGSRAARKKVEELQQTMEKKSFEIEARKIYWSLVANQESTLVSQQMYNTARRQLEEAQRRFQESVADRAEVTRYKAQLASRRATLTSLEFQKQQIFMSLKAMLPFLDMDDLKLAPYNIKMTVLSVLQCTESIKEHKDVPWEQTSADEILKLLDQELEQKNSAADRHDGADVNLFGQVDYTGLDKGYDNSFSDLQENGKPSYTVGLELTVPIGGRKSASETLQKMVHKKSYEVEQLDLKAKVRAQHQQMVPLISMLQKAVDDQAENAGLLDQTVRETEKKFNQARVTVDALIRDQNALQSAQIDQIRTKLAVIHAVLDYFKVFNQSPCAINQI